MERQLFSIYTIGFYWIGFSLDGRKKDKIIERMLHIIFKR